MRVDRVSTSGRPISRSGERTKTDGASEFSSALETRSSESSSVSGSAPVSPVASVLAIQEVGDSTSGPSRGILRGLDLLERLENLRQALVLGTLTVTQIERLAALAAGRKEQVNDPALAEILNEIEIRAAVELAKLGR